MAMSGIWDHNLGSHRGPYSRLYLSELSLQVLGSGGAVNAQNGPSQTPGSDFWNSGKYARQGFPTGP